MAKRIIKFRLWDIKLGKMFKNYEGDKDYQDGWVISDVGVVNYMFDLGDKYTWLQYSGMNCTEGVEIYEHDIVEYTNNKGIKKTMLICYDGGSFHMKTSKGKKHFKEYNVFPQMIFNSKMKVIGNLYENPELLTPTIEVTE